MKLKWTNRAWEDYQRWRQTDSEVYKNIKSLIVTAQHNPYEGRGRPKALQDELKGWWSREIDEEHRLIYRVSGKGRKQALEILQCYGHYND